MGARKELNFTADLQSDCACLNGLAETIIEAGREAVHVLRDATRGGLAAVVNEMAAASRVTIAVEEQLIPVSEKVKAVCSLLGMQPWDLANEGKLVVAVAPDGAESVLTAMRSHELGKESAIIGAVEEKGRFPAVLTTPLGVRTILEMPRGELLPRIC